MGLIEKVQTRFRNWQEEEYEDEYDYVEEEYEEEEPIEKPKEQSGFQTYRSNSPKTVKTPPSDNVARIHPENMNRICVVKLESIDDAPDVVSSLRANCICIISLEGVEREKAQRIADFLGGASHAMCGNIERINSCIFIMAPAGTDISNSLKQEMKSGSSLIPWLSSAIGGKF